MAQNQRNDGFGGAFPPTGRLLIVSPHLDDAALSCDALLRRSDATDVLTVFAGSPDPPQHGFWDELCGFRDSAEAIQARRAEEEAALRDDVTRLTFLDLAEAQYVDARSDSDAEAVAAAVAAWTGEGSSATVALPAGAGWTVRGVPRPLLRVVRDWRGPLPHPDHVFVRDAVLPAVPNETAVVLYEEFPYALAGAADGAVARVAARHGRTVHAHLVEIDRERKARRISAYASQIPHLTKAGRLDEPSLLPESERYWLLERRR